MRGVNIKIPYNGNTIPGYTAEPIDGRKPGVIVIGAIFGVDDDIKGIVERLASNGFLAIAPNMFWEDPKGDTDVLPVSIEGSERGRARAGRVDRDSGVAYIEACMEFLIGSPYCDGKIVLQGYCFGGPFVLQAAARLQINAGFSYHGSYVERFLGDLEIASCPLQFHYGDSDTVAPMVGSVDVMQAACEKQDNAEVFVYPGGQHSYMFPSRGNVFLKEAADLSWKRTLELIDGL